MIVAARRRRRSERVPGGEVTLRPGTDRTSYVGWALVAVGIVGLPLVVVAAASIGRNVGENDPWFGRAVGLTVAVLGLELPIALAVLGIGIGMIVDHKRSSG
jgi:chromate transport protein ChrA